ncbi:hypothetical protein NPIL_422211 [Nephila pilipes]|uniref:Uncharacterized protein n=1 Tax=Nephila pilipes TaxID=299642 RepID=A0A8X6NAQ4_NEPPI|nr:hypothetical protein NPIL_422211 [Nephila pilipes]
MEPFSNFSPQGSHLCICYYHQDLHRRRLQAGSRQALPRHRRDPPTRFSTKILISFGEPAGYGLYAGAPSIFRASCFGRQDFGDLVCPSTLLVLIRHSFLRARGEHVFCPRIVLTTVWKALPSERERGINSYIRGKLVNTDSALIESSSSI